MKTRLYKKWLKVCRQFDEGYFSRLYKKNAAKYASVIGDKFFASHVKHSRHWAKLKIECDLNGWQIDGIWKEDHPLHCYCPSARLKNWSSTRYSAGIDFASMYANTIMWIVDRSLRKTSSV